MGIATLGSKRRILQYILPIMRHRGNAHKPWLEPFVGGCNVLFKVKGQRHGNDINPCLIAYFTALQRGWMPPRHVGEDFYNQVRENIEDYPLELVAYIGFSFSYASKFFAGYAREKREWTQRRNENYRSGIAYAKAKDLAAAIGSSDVTFSCGQFFEMPLSQASSVIYCDPPYRGTTEYKYSLEHADFWAWVRQRVEEGHEVFISEYRDNPPADFVEIWHKHARVHINNSNGKLVPRVEALFVHESVSHLYRRKLEQTTLFAAWDMTF